jgi:hypothetical protein
MKALMIVSIMMLAQGVAADTASLTVEGNSIQSAYSLLECDMEEAYVGWDSRLSFRDDDSCTVRYMDTAGRPCELVIEFESDYDMTGYEVELVVSVGGTERTVNGTFSGRFCSLSLDGVESGSSLVLSGFMPDVRGVGFDITLSASPDGGDHKAYWALWA